MQRAFSGVQQRQSGTDSPVRLHPGTGASPTKQKPKALPKIDSVTPAIIHWDGPCECVAGRELCRHCKRRGHPFAEASRSSHQDSSPQRFASPSPVQLSVSQVALDKGPVFPMDGISAFAPFRTEIEKMNGVVEKAEDKLKTSLINRVVENTSQLMDQVCAPKLQLKDKQHLVEKHGKKCVKLLQQRDEKSAHVRRRAAHQVIKLLDQFSSELASRANSEFEGTRASEIQKREKVAKQLRYKLDHAYYEVDSQVQQHVASIQAEANSRVAERDAELLRRDETIATLKRELAVMQTLNSKLVERENLAAERLAKDAIKVMKQPPEGGYNQQLTSTPRDSAASAALLGTPHTP